MDAVKQSLAERLKRSVNNWAYGASRKVHLYHSKAVYVYRKGRYKGISLPFSRHWEDGEGMNG